MVGISLTCKPQIPYQKSIHGSLNLLSSNAEIWQLNDGIHLTLFWYFPVKNGMGDSLLAPISTLNSLNLWWLLENEMFGSMRHILFSSSSKLTIFQILSFPQFTTCYHINVMALSASWKIEQWLVPWTLKCFLLLFLGSWFCFQS